MAKLLTEAQLLDVLESYVAKAHGGSQAKAAEALGISPSYLCDVLKARRGIGAKLYDAMGYTLVEAYRKRA